MALNHYQPQAQGFAAGTFNIWPTCSRRGWILGLAAKSASTLTRYCRAIMVAVSPALTLCNRGVALVAVGREPLRAKAVGLGLSVGARAAVAGLAPGGAASAVTV